VPASTPCAQEHRRPRSGAFAAEFLLPVGALEAASAGHLDGAADAEHFSELLHKFGIGARTAAHQLYNHGLLSSDVVRDDLIEQFAKQP